MSVIFTDTRTGKVSMASLLTIQKDGRILLFPQMIDITDVQDIDEIAKLILDFEKKLIFEQTSETNKTFWIKVKEYCLKKWNS